MTPAEGWDLVLKALGLFGGGAVLTIAIAGFVSKLMADRSIESHKAQLGQETERLKGELAKETETHKLNLRKQEILYNKQLDAATEFIGLHQTMQPRFSHPDKDWDEACEDVAESFGMYEEWLKAYVRKHGAVTSRAVRKLLDESIDLASTNKFNVSGGDVSRDQVKAASDFMKALEKCEEVFLQEIQS
jgi:hypothetical protein